MPLSSPLLRLRKETSALLRLAGPIMVAQLAYAAMGFVDALMAGRVGARDLAAVALGNSIWVPLYLLITGILLATTAKVAERFGGGRLDEIGVLVRQALWLGLALGLIGAGLLLAAEPVLRFMEIEARLIEPTMGYLQGVAIGYPAIALFSVLRCNSEGLGLTRPSMLLGIIGLLLNIPLNYIFIYGHLGLPAMGGAGCGWATGVVMWVMLLGMAGWTAWAKVYRACGIFRRFDPPNRKGLGSLLRIGLPIGIAVFAEASIFSVIALLIGSLGVTVVAGHQIALNFSSLVFMIPYALGMAVTVRVGHALGSGEPGQARFRAWVGIGTALIYACLSASLMLLLRDPIASLYTADQQVIALAASLLVFAALFQFSDALQVTAAGALRGYQDTRMTMLITLLSYWGVGLPVGYSLGLSSWLGDPSGPAGLWQGLVVGLTCSAILLCLRLHKITRRREQLAGR
jgi:MATE family multidrug resistance protein